jgi:hypothetical protein
MTTTRITWVVLTAIYLSFFSWYTSFGGPLTEEEVEHYMSGFESRTPAPPPERLTQIRKFLEEDTGDDFVMGSAAEACVCHRSERGPIEKCEKCGGPVRIIASIEDPDVIEKILKHLGLDQPQDPQNRSPPSDLTDQQTTLF